MRSGRGRFSRKTVETGMAVMAESQCHGGCPLRLFPGSTISTWLHDKINPKNCEVLSLGDSGFLQFFRVVSREYGKLRFLVVYLKVIFFLHQPYPVIPYR